jgi:hypothetical protein
MVAVGSVFLFGGRSETIRLMARPDERWRSIDLAATAITGLVLILVIIGAPSCGSSPTAAMDPPMPSSARSPASPT